MTPSIKHDNLTLYISEFSLNIIRVLRRLVFLLLAFAALSPAQAETCGVCKDSYLKCAAGGTNLDTCASRLRSCESACFGTGNSSDTASSSGNHPGDNPAIVGISFGLLFSLGIWALAANASTPQGAYKGVIWLSGLCLAAIFALCLAIGMKEQDSQFKSFLVWGLLFFALPFGIPFYFQRKSSLAAEEQDAERKEILAASKRQSEIDQIESTRKLEAAARAKAERAEKAKESRRLARLEKKRLSSEPDAGAGNNPEHPT